jgi:predicted Zn-dependent peptidase
MSPKKLRFDLFEFDESVTANTPVYVKNLPWVTDWIEVRILIRAGARHDSFGKEGLAHFFEHFPFQGCRNFPDYLTVTQAEDKILNGNSNANTGFDRTCFNGKVFRKDLGKAIDFWHNLIFHPLFIEEEIEKERSVIIREIWRKLNNKKVEEFAKAVMPKFYLSQNHPIGRMLMPFGWEESVRRISLQDLINFHSDYYHANNLAIVMVGDINLSEATDQSERFLEGVARKKATEIAKSSFESWPAPLEEFATVTFEEAGLPSPEYSVVEFYRLFADIDYLWPLEILNGMLRKELFLKIRQELGATYGANISKSLYQDHIFWKLEVNTEPYSQSIHRTRRIFYDVLEAIRDGKRSNEFEQAKRKKLANKLLMDMDVESVADNAADDLALSKRIIPIREEINRINNITYKQVRKMVAEELDQKLLFRVEFYP